mmetsp:Transcript_22139/g.36672  ORF Transcript_22139/g.36672 Transcript_22139/m.36672 type:complete len:608 (+) Transcript_22139:46-1869(+)
MENELELAAVIGFGGSVSRGLVVHPNGKEYLFPLGSTVIVRDVKNPRNQYFLQGHSDRISCLALSRSGKYVATGHITYQGFQAGIVIWDLESRTLLHRLTLHKVKVQSLAFSYNERFLASVGGQDDGNIVIWDVNSGQPICGSPAANDNVHVVRWFNTRDDMLVSAGNFTCRVWEFDLENRKVRPTDCNLGKLKRVIHDVHITPDDERMYVATGSGDLLDIRLGPKLLRITGPKKPVPDGIHAITQLPNRDVIVGGGDGTIAILNGETLQQQKSITLQGAVSSLVLLPDASGLYVGTKQANMYFVSLPDLKADLRATCHSGPISDIAYPRGYSELFATCSKGDIRVWHARNCTELLRIQVPGVDCLCIIFSTDGKAILSGWSDGKVRAFGPQTGKLLFVINGAHLTSVTAIATTNDSMRLVTGGADGQVRVWKLGKESQTMLAMMKEHSAAINCLAVRANDAEFVSASSDGSCIIWDLKRYVRNNSLFASTFFKAVTYFPDESQILTAGTDRKLSYWDAYDGSAIRVLEGSEAEINALDISSGRGGQTFFVSGGADKSVKIWDYESGQRRSIGIGHSGAITRVKISHDQKTIVSVGEEGAILLWKAP